jgi:uncharacterized membrane protein YfcA
MSLLTILLLFSTALVGSALNAVAGGGSFFTFPALLFCGAPILGANATSTFALWPGALSSAYTYRNELDLPRRPLIVLLTASFFGSLLGTILLLMTPSDLLKSLLPYLIGSATLLLIFKKQLAGKATKPAPTAEGSLVRVAIFQFFISIYGGYFGGGMGILMLAALSLMGFKSLLQMNALKVVLGTCINSVAVFLFVLNGQILWQFATVMVIGGIIGGYLGAYFGSRIPARILHFFIIGVGVFFTIWFAVHG